MIRLILKSALIILGAVTCTAAADPLRATDTAILSGGPGARAKAAVDTVNLMSTHDDPTNGVGEPAYLGDFQDHLGLPAWNGWTSSDLSGSVGDFAQIWPYLEEIDLCRTNYSPQVAFIDDGVVVPGTGGSFCLTWCYGPYGYIVSPDGGMSPTQAPLHNAITSPVMDWPTSDYSGALLAFDVYHHLGTEGDNPGIYYYWSVRSADSDGSAGLGVQDIETQPWEDQGFVYAGRANYERISIDVSDLMVAGRDQVQIRLAARQIAVVFGGGLDGTPTPYFDNVTLKVYDRTGPALTALRANLAQDAFPASGIFDLENLADLSVRFDMARNIAPPVHLHNDPGDSIVVRVQPLGPGAVISPAPRLEYVLDPEPRFDPHRTAGLPTAGFVVGAPVLEPGSGTPTGEWFFDLPDSGFLFPGDRLHYLIVATETGPQGTHASFLPADTSGFHDFSSAAAYDPDFSVNALPGVFDLSGKTVITTGGPALFWFDAEDLDGLPVWLEALETFSPVGQPQFTSFDFDLFVTRNPSAGLGNGLGGRATAAQLDHYGTIIYSSGDESSGTLAFGDPDVDVSNDIALLTQWLDAGDRHLFVTGDNLAADLDNHLAGQAFLNERLGAALLTDDIRPFIDSQTAPVVAAESALDLFLDTPKWVAYGGCLEINRFDGIEPVNGGLLAAQFTNPGGQVGAYPFAAAVWHEADLNTVITLPTDFKFIYATLDSPPGPYTGRTALLADVLHAFMYMWGPVSDVPALGSGLAVTAHPNPFNPRVAISYAAPGGGPGSVKIYDIRGAHVRTVVEGELDPAGEAVWDGRDDAGRAVSSGIYFYEVVHGKGARIGKLVLVR